MLVLVNNFLRVVLVGLGTLNHLEWLDEVEAIEKVRVRHNIEYQRIIKKFIFKNYYIIQMIHINMKLLGPSPF